NATAAALMSAYWTTTTENSTSYDRNHHEIDDVLIQRHKLPLSKEDLDGIAYAYHAFYWYGPGITWSSTTTVAGKRITYADLMTQADASGSALSFLSSEATFSAVKDLQRRNMVIPVVGNFAGPKSLRAIGEYVRQHQAIVSVF